MKKFTVEFCTISITHRILQGALYVIALSKEDAMALAQIMIRQPIEILSINEIGYL